MIRYPLFMTVNEGMLSKDSVVTGKLKSVLVAEGGAVSHHADASTRFQPLITLGKDSGTVNAAAALFTNPLDLARTLKVDGSERFVAASVTGRFRSAFAGGPPAGVTSVNSRQCS
jgi:aconitase B